MNKEFILIADGYYNNYYYLATYIQGIYVKSEGVKRKEEWLKILNLTEDKVTIKNN